MRAFKLLRCFLLLLLLSLPLAAEERALITLKGFIGKDSVDDALKRMDDPQLKEVVIEVNSSGGNLPDVLRLAKKLYELKVGRQNKIVVYMNDQSIGPGAMIPFLADDLYSSLFVSWGSIPYGTHDEIPVSLLKNRVLSLIDPNDSHRDILRVFAAGMTDPSLIIYDDGQWKQTTEESKVAGEIISPEGETLIVNHQQLKALGLIKGLLSDAQFIEKMRLAPEQQEQLTKEPEKQAILKQGKIALGDNLKEHIKFDPSGPNTVGYIAINDKDDQISQSTWIYVKNALDEFRKNKPVFIILELNTPGGQVFAAEKICDALQEIDTQAGIPVVAYINNWAISAGAMIAYSCRYIVATKDASMGAAEPVLMGEGGKMETASEKVNSALRTDFANRASYFDRNPLIAEAMVDKDLVLVVRNGEITKLKDDAEIRTKGPNPDQVITTKGKLLTLNSEELMRYGVANIRLTPTKLEMITAEEREVGKWPADKMALFHQPFFEEIPDASVDAYTMDWRTRFFVLLTTPAAASLLFLGMIIGFYIEFNTPGFGVPGSLGLLCLILIGMSSYALELANWLEVALFLVGVLLLAIELFVIPSFGIVGIIGLLFLFAGLFGMMLPGVGTVDFEYDTGTFNAAGEVFMERLAWFSGTLLVAIAIIVLLARYLTPRTHLFGHLVLVGGEQDAKEGYVSSERSDKLPPPGTKGTVATALHPSGKVIVNDVYYDALTMGNYIDEGEKIVVVRVDGSSLVVTKEEEA